MKKPTTPELVILSRRRRISLLSSPTRSGIQFFLSGMTEGGSENCQRLS